VVTAAPILAASRTRSHDLPPGSYRRTTARKLQADRQISFELDQLDSDEAEEFYFAYGVWRQLDVL
jgi:hypothetical protein